jgi:hypothetical protein
MTKRSETSAASLVWTAATGHSEVNHRFSGRVIFKLNFNFFAKKLHCFNLGAGKNMSRCSEQTNLAVLILHGPVKTDALVWLKDQVGSRSS